MGRCAVFFNFPREHQHFPSARRCFPPLSLASSLPQARTLLKKSAEIILKSSLRPEGHTTCARLTASCTLPSDIDKNYTLKVKVQTAYKLTFEVGTYSAPWLILGDCVLRSPMRCPRRAAPKNQCSLWICWGLSSPHCSRCRDFTPRRAALPLLPPPAGHTTTTDFLLHPHFPFSLPTVPKKPSCDLAQHRRLPRDYGGRAGAEAGC